MYVMAFVYLVTVMMMVVLEIVIMMMEMYTQLYDDEV